ncbi:MAG: hypothetical protein AB7K68_06990 [Bacteriovoracia bacterium]
MKPRVKYTQNFPYALLSLLALVFLVTACKMPQQSAKVNVTPTPRPGPTPRSVLVSWTANRETAVNSAGGGYKVYYSSTSGFVVSAGNLVEVPYVSGASAPTSTTLSLVPGTYYIRVAAYSALNPLSTASTQISLVVPAL